MNALFAPGAKRTRILVAFGLTLLLAAPAMIVWAYRPAQGAGTSQEEADSLYEAAEARWVASTPLPPAFMPLPENSPFGGAFRPKRLADYQAQGMLRSPIGDVSWDLESDAFIQGLRPGLRWGQGDVTRGPKGHLRPGLNYVHLSQAAVAARGLDAALRSVAENATILFANADRTLLVKVEANRMQALRSLDVIDRVAAYIPAFKISPTYGGRPEIMKARASSEFVRAIITLVPGESPKAVAEDLRSMQGVRNVTEKPFGYQVQAEISNKTLERIAQDDRVLNLDPERDMMTMAMESVPGVQSGATDDARFIRPFDVLGVDGGGINAAGLAGQGNRNDGTAIVAPQIVLVVDNGISIDTPNFSQTRSDVTTIAPFGPAHRKIQDNRSIGADTSSCDGPLSGSSTHGHIVASLIGANLTAFNVFVTKSGIGGGVEVRNGNFDGMARGARILFQDVGNSASQCTLNAVVEHGGNVTPGSLWERLNQSICPGTVPPAPAVCHDFIGGGGEVHLGILPFGAPANFSSQQFGGDNGTYPETSEDVDRFLYNNRDFAVFSPVGNNGGLPNSNRIAFMTKRIPDLFNGTAIDDNPNVPRDPQIPPPATAKNVITVGATRGEAFTRFGGNDQEENTARFSSRGPATGESGRQAPIVTTYGFDLLSEDNPYTGALAVVRSNDDDNQVPIDVELDEGNFGTSFSAALLTGGGAIMRDYFAQGFYPTGARGPDTDRIPNISGSAIKALMIASGDFTELVNSGDQRNASNALAMRARCADLGVVNGRPDSIPTSESINIFCNSEGGYGRVVLTHVLPLAGWSDDHMVHPEGGDAAQTREFPAGGLLLFDRIGTGEPLIDNTPPPCAAGANCSHISHTFRVLGQPTITKANGGVALVKKMLRIGLAWPDMPSEAGTGGVLINDLDMVLEGPGPDNCLEDSDKKPNGDNCLAGSAADNEFFDGNRYFTPTASQQTPNQWALARVAGGLAEKHEFRNPHEALHLTSDLNSDFNPLVASPTFAEFADSQIYVGRYKITVRRGWGPEPYGSIPVQGEDPITIIPVPTEVDGDEDNNGNGRLDLVDFVCGTGEDLNDNCQLDQPGQPYSLVIAGPVVFDAAELAASGPPAKGPTTFPAALISFDKNRYGCADTATLNVIDPGAGVTPGSVQSHTTFQVTNAAGGVADSEGAFTFAVGASPAQFKALVPVRLGAPAIPNNGLLEVDTGQTINATYDADGGGAIRAVSAKAAVRCSPEMVNGVFLINDNTAFGTQFSIVGGCDYDDSMDAGEVVTYGVALNNTGRDDSYADLIASLTPSGPGAGAITVLDSPKNTGALLTGNTQGVFFQVKVDKTAANALPVANRSVTMTLNLESLVRGVRIVRQSYQFTHPINADRETLNYSTDHPAGGVTELRDLNRNLQFDEAEVVDPFLSFVVPGEAVTFNTMFAGSGGPGGVPTNLLGEDLDNGNDKDSTERDILPGAPPYGPVDRGILIVNNPAATQRVPWSFDANDGGWRPFRHPASLLGTATIAGPVWEHKLTGLCGFQTQSGTVEQGVCTALVCTNPLAAGRACAVNDDCDSLSGAGIWHTGDSDVNTPNGASTACDNFKVPSDHTTGPRVEIMMDVLESPVIAKVNQLPDSRAFPYTVEFQRFGFNELIQTNNGYTGGGIMIDNNADNDNIASMLGEQLDTYYLIRRSGWAHNVARLAYDFYFAYYGIYTTTSYIYQRTFGPPDNPDSSVSLNGDEQGINPFTEDTNPNSSSPIPLPQNTAGETNAARLPYPIPGAEAIGLCVGGTNDGDTCDPAAGGADPCVVAGGSCTEAPNTPAGPVRSFDMTLVGWEGQSAFILNDPANIELLNPSIQGQGSNRWQIGISFWAMESADDATDYGIAMDDVVFEWREWHPVDESVFSPAHTPACDRFTGGLSVNAGGVKFSAGGMCASLTADRTTLYDCDEAMEVTVFDAKCRTLGAGATSTLYGPCTTSAQCGTGGLCSAQLDMDPANPGFDVQIQVVTDSDSVPVPIATGVTVDYPNEKLYTLSAVPGSPGLYKGTITFSTANVDQNDTKHIRTTPGSDGVFSLYYHDPICDADRDGQAAEDSFTNVDGDGIAEDDGDAVADPCTGGDVTDCDDNCPQIYNPAQEDADGDGFGLYCDNCPAISNPTQADTNEDGVGDKCDYDDVDGDGVSNETDNCADVSNADQANVNGGSSKGDACDLAGTDRDNDGYADAVDNCVLTPNGPAGFGQDNADGDRLGDVCDGDCQGVVETTVCAHDGVTSCVQDSDCTNGLGLPAKCQSYLTNTGGCSSFNDDFDVDGNQDPSPAANFPDNCPTIYNHEIIANTHKQRDRDNDGLGEECDPTGSFDDSIDGIPDDVVNYNGTIACRLSPLANLTINSVEYQDFDGDGDQFPDTGEFGRLKLSITNVGTALTEATLVLLSSDPGVGCITKPTIFVGSWARSETKLLGDFGGVGPTFEFKASPSLTFVPPPAPEVKVSFCLTVFANETGGMVAPKCFSLGADKDLPGGPGDQTFVLGPDGIANTADDGVITENFDIDKNGDGFFSIKDTFLQRDVALGPNEYRGRCVVMQLLPGPVGTVGQKGIVGAACETDAECPGGFCYSGGYIRSSADGVDLNTMAGIQCGGYDIPGPGETGCRIDPDNPMDWHFHCKNDSSLDCTNPQVVVDATHAGGVTTCCPNFESQPCFNNCSYETPLMPGGGVFGKTAPNSLHMGGHWNANDNTEGDGTHFRTVQAFMTAPINLALFPAPGQPLEMSFYHIARLADNNGVSGSDNQCFDCADVQIQLDSDPNGDPLVDQWGFWDKLTPTANVYDKKAQAWSVTGVNNCRFTPIDAGDGPPNPNGKHEMMCYPQGVWARCGSTGLGAKELGDCNGPGAADSGGLATWVQTKFNLAPYLGQRVRIRWIGDTWEFGAAAEAYFTVGWGTSLNEDGWWLDDIRVQGAIASQLSPRGDTRPDPGNACSAVGCNENAPSSDMGTLPAVQVTDLALNVLDGITTFPVSGESIRISAINSTMPGGCLPGNVTEYQFSEQGICNGGHRFCQNNPAVACSALGTNTDPACGAGGICAAPNQGAACIPATANCTGGGACTGRLLQDFTPKHFFLDAPEGIRTYVVRTRCSSDFSCTSAVGASATVQPVTGDGSDSFFANPPNASLGFRYFRGHCGAGTPADPPCNSAVCVGGTTVGLSCTVNTNCGGGGLCVGVNDDCGAGGTCAGLLGPSSVPANAADDVLRVSIVGNAGGNLMDLYRGTANGEVITIGAQPNPPTGTTVSLASSVHRDHVNFFQNVGPAKQYREDYTNAQDGVPGSNSAFYYTSVGHSPAGLPVNGLSYPNPGVCNNTGWCNQSTGGTAGAPCTLSSQCPGGTCTNMASVSKPYCVSEIGSGPVGGCGRHTTCVAGPTPGKLCLNITAAVASNTTDCGSGGTCSAYSTTASTPGQICYKVESFAAQQPFNQGGLPPGNAKHLIDQALPANVCP